MDPFRTALLSLRPLRVLALLLASNRGSCSRPPAIQGTSCPWRPRGRRKASRHCRSNLRSNSPRPRTRLSHRSGCRSGKQSYLHSLTAVATAAVAAAAPSTSVLLLASATAAATSAEIATGIATAAAAAAATTTSTTTYIACLSTHQPRPIREYNPVLVAEVIWYALESVRLGVGGAIAGQGLVSDDGGAGRGLGLEVGHVRLQGLEVERQKLLLGWKLL